MRRMDKCLIKFEFLYTSLIYIVNKMVDNVLAYAYPCSTTFSVNISTGRTKMFVLLVLMLLLCMSSLLCACAYICVVGIFTAIMGMLLFVLML